MRLFTSLLFSADFLGCGDKLEDTGTEDPAATSTEPTDETADEPVDEPEDTASTEDSPEELGKVLYEANCTGCHGEDATGVSAPGILDHSDEKFFNAVQNGKGYMPAFPDLSDTDIGNIIADVRSL